MKQEKRSKKNPVLRWCLLAVLALIIGINLYSFNATTLAGNAMPMRFGIGSAVVLSGSMEPTLSVNDYVIVQAADSYAVGDIVVYQSGNSLVIHRVVEIDGENIIARGDARMFIRVSEALQERLNELRMRGNTVHLHVLEGGAA